MYRYAIVLATILFCYACSPSGSGGKQGMPMRLNDPRFIVNEVDSQYLVNKVRDITPKRTVKENEAQVEKIIAKVDSVKEVIAIQSTNTLLTGITINANGFVISSYLKLIPSNDEYTFSRAAYTNPQIKVDNLSEAKVSQTYFTKLYYSVDNKLIELFDMPEKRSASIELINSANTFALAPFNKAEAPSFDNHKLSLAIDRALRKEGKQRVELEAAQAKIKAASDYNTAGISLVPIKTILLVEGKLNGKAEKYKLRINLTD